MVICSIYRTLQLAPKAFDGICKHFAPGVLALTVIHYIMLNAILSRPDVNWGLVRVECACVNHIIVKKLFGATHRRGIASPCSDLAISLYYTEYRDFVSKLHITTMPTTHICF